jgi:hypothetical protein
LPQQWEKFGFFLPRFLLDWGEIRACPSPVPDTTIHQDLDFWRNRRVALVRQSAYQSLYSPGVRSAWEDVVLSAAKHFGPFSLLADLGADYRVVRQAAEPETYLWKGKYSLDPDPQSSWSHAMERTRAWEASAEGRQAISVDDVDWSDYDLVVGIDVPIPERIVKQCPRTLWTYYSVEAGGPLQKNSLFHPAAGYHIFLNHGFRRFRCRPRNRRHVLEFPFTFQSRRAWEELARHAGLEGCVRKNQVILDRASPPPSRIVSRLLLHHLEGNSGQNPARAYLGQMTSSRFAIRTDPKTRWGNWAVEAIQAGCLFLGRADSLAMPGILLPGLIAETTDQAWAKAEELLEQPDEFDLFVRLQGALADYLCFQRPLADLTQQARSFLGR